MSIDSLTADDSTARAVYALPPHVNACDEYRRVEPPDVLIS